MTEKPTIQWRALIAESIAIVVSVLLAFAIQAWWEGVGEERERVSALRQIEADFDAMRSSAEAVLQIQARHLSAVTELLGLIRPDARTTVSRADTLLAVLISGPFAEFHGERGAMTASSIRVDRVESPRLKRLLAQWPSLVEVVSNFHDERQVLMQSRMAPYLQSRVPVRSFDVAMGNVEAEPSRFSLDVSPLLRDLEFENLINEEAFFTTRTVESLTTAVEAADEILVLLGEELAR